MLINKTAKVLALGSILMLGNEAAFAADKGLLDTLLQNGSITPAQYDNLTKPKVSGISDGEVQGLNEVLLQNGVINQVQYDELTKQEVAEAKTTVAETKQEVVKESGDDVLVKLDQKGFRVETRDKAFKFKLGGRVQVDANFSANRTDFNNSRPDEGVEVRRARLYASGVLWNDFQYKAQFDFAGNKVGIKDLFVKYTGFDWVDITVGNQKQAISMELQESSNDIMFTERSLVSSLTATQFDRALGLRLSSAGKNWSAQLGAYGSPVSNTKSQGWGVSSRATYAPILSSTQVLHLGAYAGYRGQSNANRLARFKYESTNQSSVYFTDTGTIENVSGTTLAGIEAAYMFGPFSMQSEYAHSWLARNSGESGVDFGAYYVQGAWTITGESRTYKVGHSGKFKRLKPENPFSWARGTWGAWELATRIDGNDLNSGDIQGGEETFLTLALNWYLNTNIRLMADYRYAFNFQNSPYHNVDENGDVENDGVGNGLHAFTLRTQLTF